MPFGNTFVAALTSGSSYNNPGHDNLTFELIGGGQGGGSDPMMFGGQTGGIGGDYAAVTQTVLTGSETYSYTIGAAGTAGTGTGGDTNILLSGGHFDLARAKGGNSGNTTSGDLTAAGGTGAAGSGNNGGGGGGAASGAGGGPGIPGSNGSGQAAGTCNGFLTGSVVNGGNGGVGGSSGANGGAGSNYGGGGGGGGLNGTGGVGAQGVIVVSTYVASPPPPPPPPPGDPTVYGSYHQEITLGPPMRGAPWLAKRLPVTPADYPLASPPPPPPPPPPPVQALYHNEIVLGPPMRGAPWLGKRLPIIPTTLVVPPPAGPVPTFAQEIRLGPPMRGAPWLGKRIPIQPTSTVRPAGPAPSPPPPGHSGVGRGFPLINRHETSEARLRDFTEKVRTLLNSLGQQGQIALTGPGTFTLQVPAYQAARAPLATDDAAHGFIVGMPWVNTATQALYFCVSNTTNAAVWRGPI